MKDQKIGYYIVNSIIIVIAIGLLIHIVYANVIKTLIKENLAVIISVFLWAGLIYVIKAVRLYLIMLERRITIRRFIKVYMKTTLVNLALPFKSGEIFRIYCYGNEMKSYKLSFLCVMIDRYFDTIPLLILLLCFTIITSRTLLPVVLILLLFVLLMTVTYEIFPSTYHYMNKFLIMETNSKNGVRALVLLNKANGWYKYATELIKGRGMILLILSSITWLMEYGLLLFLAWGLSDTFKMIEFVDYMNSVFVGSNNRYVTLYVGISAVLVVIAAVGIYGLSFRKRIK
jgi:hypothetical protein